MRGLYEIIEDLGCINTLDFSVATVLLVEGWEVLFPVLSSILFCRESSNPNRFDAEFIGIIAKIIYVLMREKRQLNRQLDSGEDSGIDRSAFYRISVLGLLDVIITLPVALGQIINSRRVRTSLTPLFRGKQPVSGRTVTKGGNTDRYSTDHPLF